MYELALYTSLVQYFEINGLNDDEQHSFRTEKWLTTASINLIETVVDDIDRGDSDSGVFMDLCKGLIVCAIKQSSALLRIWDSSLKVYIHGIPQGSILGHVFFLLFKKYTSCSIWSSK